jgi:transposase
MVAKKQTIQKAPRQRKKYGVQWTAEYRVSDKLWAIWKPLIPQHVNTHRFGGGRPRTPDRQCADAIYFQLRTGCQWKALDETGICSGSVAHARFQEWVTAGVFERLWIAALTDYDEAKGLDWSWLSMDGAMTKSPLGGGKTGHNPTDRSKLGVKRSVLTEAQGIPVGVAVDGANRHDMKLVRTTLESIPVERPAPTPDQPQGMCMDKAYDYDEVREVLQEFGFTAHIRARGEEAQALKREAGFKARRWVVERTHSWMNRFRGILIRWAKKTENYLALLHLVFAAITARAAELSG